MTEERTCRHCGTPYVYDAEEQATRLYRRHWCSFGCWRVDVRRSGRRVEEMR